jgi:hypothetical protein
MVCGRENRLREAQHESRNRNEKYFCLEWEPAPGTTVDVGSLADESSTTRQKSLMFTRLPLEVRFRIYSLAMPQHRRLWVRRASRDMNDRRLEHFPCARPPADTSRVASPGCCCVGVKNNFFEHVRANGVQPHRDSLALMRTCRQV